MSKNVPRARSSTPEVGPAAGFPPRSGADLSDERALLDRADSAEPMADGFLWQCSRCGRGFLLLMRLPGGDLCGACALETKAAPPVPSDQEVFAQAQRTRERMMARGGTARHLVRKGLT